jgi:hypothetical protein
VLFLAVRNKYCCVCARAENKNIQPIDHKCFKNFGGPSTSMESDIIIEGFKRSIEMHGVKYMRLIGDGDSSISKKLCEIRPYGSCSMVEKIECTNHLLRNFSKHLRELATRKKSNSKNLPVSPQLRKIVTARSYRLVAAVKKAVEHRSKENGSLREQITLLIKDMKNAPSHVFGEHKECSEIKYVNCQKEGETNYIEIMSTCGLYEDIELCFKRLIDNAFSLILNMTNNLAEQYNSIVCKFIGGKRINFSLKGGYQTRCEAAAVSFNSGGDYHRLVHKELIQKSPHGSTKKYIEKMKKRKSYYEKSKLSRKQLFKQKPVAPPDEHYGTEATQLSADMSEEEYCERSEKFLARLKKTTKEIRQIEEDTRGQAGNPLWFQEHSNRITASNFKVICSMRKTTSCVNTVANLLYGTFTGNSNTRYGRRNEMRAIQEFQKKFEDLKVESCGFFIDNEDFMLGASPDGLIGNDAIIEVKCPAKAAHLTPLDAIKQKIITYIQVKSDEELILKKNHAYFYQIQGQLHITKRKVCYFVIWTPLGIYVEQVKLNELHLLYSVNKIYF